MKSEPNRITRSDINKHAATANIQTAENNFKSCSSESFCRLKSAACVTTIVLILFTKVR